MNDLTVKKNRNHPALLLVTAMAGGTLWFASSAMVKQYQMDLVMGDLSTGGKIGLFIFCFLLYTGMIFFCSFSVGQLMRWLIDHERYVVIRKSSMENVHAKQIYENYRRKIRRISLVNALILDTLLALLLMIFVVNGGSRTQFMWGIVILCFLSAINPVSRKMLKKENANRRKILLEDCNPVLYFDVYELFRMEPESNIQKNMNLLQQATACYYMCDYDEMDHRFSMIRGKMMVMQDAQRILLQGIASLDRNDPAAFQKYSDELSAYEQSPRQLQVTQNYFREIRNDWQGRIDLMSPEPVRALEYVKRELDKGKYPVLWMDFTFQLAWIEMSVGEKDRARENLKLVAERAGTMAIREKAQKMLDVV